MDSTASQEEAITTTAATMARATTAKASVRGAARPQVRTTARTASRVCGAIARRQATMARILKEPRAGATASLKTSQ